MWRGQMKMALPAPRRAWHNALGKVSGGVLLVLGDFAIGWGRFGLDRNEYDQLNDRHIHAEAILVHARLSGQVPYDMELRPTPLRVSLTVRAWTRDWTRIGRANLAGFFNYRSVFLVLGKLPATTTKSEV